MIGIIGAMQVEIDGIKANMRNISTETISGIEFVSGELEGTDVVCAVCGVGKVFAAVCAQTMIMKYKIDAMINTGIGGTLSANIGILDIAISTGVVQHDMDTTAVGDPIGLISGINKIQLPADEKLSQLAAKTADKLGIKWEKGIIASGDQFVASGERKDFIHSTFKAIACEMEGASVGHVCYINQVPFVVLRAISDDVAGNGPEDYPKFKMKAAEISNKLTCALVKEYGRA